jgi:isopentenyl phosphate kinase
MQDLVFLKLGGSVLTDKTRPEALATDTLARVARTLAESLAQPGAPRLLLGHGAGSFGHHWAQQYQTHLGVSDARGWEGVTRVSDAMGRLNRDVVGHLLAAGVRAVSVQPSASAVMEARALVEMAQAPIAMYLEGGLVPVVHGDVIVDRRQGAAIASTEMIFAFLARGLHPRRVVLVGETGVYTADPHRDPSAERIPLIDDANIDQVLGQATGSHGVDVTGGMASKVRTMWDLVCAIEGLDVLLIGPDPAAIAAAIHGDASTGTIIRRSGRVR